MQNIEAIANELLDDFSSDNKRVLYLDSDVTDENINSIITGIININKDDYKNEKLYQLSGHKYNREPIYLYINSYGGSVYDGLALIGLIEQSKTPIYTVATGKVMSMGLMLLVVGHKRFATPYTTFMFHSVNGFSCGSLQDLEADLEEKQRLNKLLVDIFKTKTSYDSKFLKKIKRAKKDYYFSTDVAIEKNVIDGLINL